MATNTITTVTITQNQINDNEVMKLNTKVIISNAQTRKIAGFLNLTPAHRTDRSITDIIIANEVLNVVGLAIFSIGICII